ncbi:28112_t:CDS:2 [Gigaspora margarita]|uniref:28112_t:CDS:1 n=1 Tax=Gigaspora margarita TaxID=4874 RepID=A0ABN7VVN4_GIGMA|nr:28112_t:CDS:2 [Gigaspora margarita]
MEIKEHNSLKEQSKISQFVEATLIEKLGQKELELEQAYKEIAQDKER